MLVTNTGRERDQSRTDEKKVVHLKGRERSIRRKKRTDYKLSVLIARTYGVGGGRCSGNEPLERGEKKIGVDE